MHIAGIVPSQLAEAKDKTGSRVASGTHPRSRSLAQRREQLSLVIGNYLSSSHNFGPSSTYLRGWKGNRASLHS